MSEAFSAPTPVVWKALALVLRQSCCRNDGLEALLEDASQDSSRSPPQCCCNVEQILCSLKDVCVDMKPILISEQNHLVVCF